MLLSLKERKKYSSAYQLSIAQRRLNSLDSLLIISVAVVQLLREVTVQENVYIPFVYLELA
jgi:hypothetical protein